LAIVIEYAQACVVRAIAICAVLAGCGQPEATPPARTPTGHTPEEVARSVAGASSVLGERAGPGGPAGWAAPGPRLGDAAVPIAYDLTLELDPDKPSFHGHVTIRMAVTAPATTRIWLHAVELEIASAKLQAGNHGEAVTVLAADATSQMRGFALPYPVGVGTITLEIDYTGHVSDLSGRAGKEEEGLFRERAGGRWYLYAQSESVFARKIVPCFDEPRWKPAWRVTAIVPRGLVALGNAPMATDRATPDGRREVRFAELPSLPSYLLAVAVGPFDVVDAGKLGRAHTPARLAVLRGDGKRVAFAVRELPRIVDALERYVDAPLPLDKLDLVAVPQFFGAMENVGLITFDNAVLVGGRDLVTVMAHELAHQWFGNSVTPAWWDHLWLSEAFASWLGERVARSLGAVAPPVLAHRSRAQALEADDQLDARPLVHPITTSADVEPAFDAIAYEKGGALLGMFERFVGDAPFQAAVRSYVAAHARTSVTSQAFIDALAKATSREVGASLASNLRHAGTPVVELTLRCGASPAVVAAARDDLTIPVCIRFPSATAAGTGRSCFLAGASTEVLLTEVTGCPAWVVGNDGGRGYYRTVWRGVAPAAPLGVLSPEERLARGDDAAISVRRGDLALGAALAELTALAMTRDPYGQLAALAIARAIDPLVADPARAAWTAWLAARFADRLTPAALTTPKSLVDHVLRRRVVALAGGAIDPGTLAAVRAAYERRPDGRSDARLRIAAARDPGALFERIVDVAATAKTADARDEAFEQIGAFPADYAPRVVELLLGGRVPAEQVWPALAAMLERREATTAAWHAIHVRIAALLGAFPAARARDVIAATASLCDRAARAEVVADFTPRIDAIDGGTRALDRALAEIDRCIAWRATAGDVVHALAATPGL
jgi:cytosol alanyl aminopeptidase